MKREQVEERTLCYHQSGLCCTESILKSITEIYGEGPNNELIKLGSGFCLGIGKTGQDICGTVVGGVMALGHLFGRTTGKETNTTACEYAAEFRDLFLEAYGTTNCDELLQKFGEQEKMDKCKAMTAKASGMIADLLASKNP